MLGAGETADESNLDLSVVAATDATATAGCAGTEGEGTGVLLDEDDDVAAGVLNSIGGDYKIQIRSHT